MIPISVWIVFGTRPEAIKMLPIVLAMRDDPKFITTVVVTAQHRDMLDQVLDIFGVVPDIDLNIMTPNQTLSELSANILVGMSELIKNPPSNIPKPDRILVHGDTSTSFVTSLAAYYNQVPVGHVEAGLRTYNLYSPFPEEGNRQLTGVLADMHFAPTKGSVANLRSEGVSPPLIYLTGNTVIDALVMAKGIIDRNPIVCAEIADYIVSIKAKYSRYILVTGHRRESHGDGFVNICKALRLIAEEHPDVCVIYAVHPNPAIADVIGSLSDVENISLIKPQDYFQFVLLMSEAHLILTDSGGIQEEAPSLGKPVLVMRDVTEREEAVFAGTVKLVGVDVDKIVSETRLLLTNDDEYAKMASKNNPYGDGHASVKIISAILKVHTASAEQY
jgi:UDP-N-acetylglucosamine 2-epimerase (non-hydrolysing)